MHYVIKKVGVIRKYWHILLTKLGKEVTVFEESFNTHTSAVSFSPAWLCPKCLKYKNWTLGCSDEYPRLCDDCYTKQQPKKEVKNAAKHKNF